VFVRRIVAAAATLVATAALALGISAGTASASTYSCGSWVALDSSLPNVYGLSCMEISGTSRRSAFWIQNSSAWSVTVRNVAANTSLGGSKYCIQNVPSSIAPNTQYYCASNWVVDGNFQQDWAFGGVEYWDPISFVYEWRYIYSPYV
jgi:hypothetical protein